jgi:hypothetical protein
MRRHPRPPFAIGGKLRPESASDFFRHYDCWRVGVGAGIIAHVLPFDSMHCAAPICHHPVAGRPPRGRCRKGAGLRAPFRDVAPQALRGVPRVVPDRRNSPACTETLSPAGLPSRPPGLVEKCTRFSSGPAISATARERTGLGAQRPRPTARTTRGNRRALAEPLHFRDEAVVLRLPVELEIEDVIANFVRPVEVTHGCDHLILDRR